MRETLDGEAGIGCNQITAEGYAMSNAKSDVYTGLLGISLVAIVISGVLLYLDHVKYGATSAAAPSSAMPR